MNPTGAEVIGEGRGGRGEGVGGGEHQTEGEDEYCVCVCVCEIVCIACVCVCLSLFVIIPRLIYVPKTKNKQKKLLPPSLPSCAAGGAPAVGKVETK